MQKLKKKIEEGLQAFEELLKQHESDIRKSQANDSHVSEIRAKLDAFRIEVARDFEEMETGAINEAEAIKNDLSAGVKSVLGEEKEAGEVLPDGAGTEAESAVKEQ